MTWIAISDHDGDVLNLRGLGRTESAATLPGADDETLLTRGSLVIETRLPSSRRPRPLIYCDRPGDWPFHLSLQAIPGGGLILVMNQGNETLHRAINHSEAGRMDILRLTYSWDAPARRAHLALERTDMEQILMVPVPRPHPLPMADAKVLLTANEHRYMAPEVQFLALSTAVEPVGPLPTLAPATPVATPAGYRPVGELKRGDAVLAADGRVVPVLHSLSRTLPARGSFRPVRLRAPYFGLRNDITVAPAQRLVLSGSEVEYLFNQEAVLVEVRHLLGGTSVLPANSGPTVTYTQLILPEHEALNAAGTVAETLYLGRLRRKRDLLAATLLAGVDRHTLPEHGKPLYPVLKAFDAIVLAEQRAA